MNFAYTSAIALLSAVFFAACSSSDETALDTTNPNYNPEEKSVTTKFVLNVSSAANTMRQTSSIVQKNSNFRGFQDAKLIGLATGKVYDSEDASKWLAPYAGGTTQTDWTTGSNIKAKVYDLGTLYGTTAVDNTDDKNEKKSSHRVVELTLPVTTDAMLVYGRAIPDDNVALNGKVTMPASYAAPENITFGLVPRLEESAAYTQTCNLAALIFNRIMLSEVAAHDVPESPTPRNGYTQKANMPALKWRVIGTKTQEEIDALAPLQQNLAIAYKVIRDTYKNSSVHSGSSASICNIIDDIYSIANSVANATATNDDELNAQRLADDIIARIGYYFNRASNPTIFNNLGEYSTETSPIYYLVTKGAASEADFQSNGKYGKVTSASLQGYPRVFNLPDGVAQLTFEDFVEGTTITGGFVFKTLENSTSLIDISQTLDPIKYTYPAELLYFDNSLLRVNDNDVDASLYPNGYDVWDKNAWTDWEIAPVTATTRSVAVKNNINYGVAMLGTTVTYDTETSLFYDNHPTSDKVTFTPNDIKAFTLTGVLIGGQFKNVGWNFIRKEDGGENATNKNFVIYDSELANGSVPSASPNYTLVFDNYQTTATNVRVALEFKNTSDKDIYGIGGMIPKGGVFYLAGNLDLSSNTETINWPTHYAIPPYTSEGKTDTTKKRVFIQDYLTTATFKITQNSLKNAYTTIPDLRASQISLGVSVDLQWRPGLNFNVDF